MILRTRDHGLSLGDRACLSLAEAKGLAAWTADRAWSKISARCRIATDPVTCPPRSAFVEKDLRPVQHVSANGAEIPAIGFGTWTLRGSAGAKAVAEAVGIGYRHIDTAAGYGNETEVGEGIRASGMPRSEIFLTTKVQPENLADGVFQKTVEGSLKRLRMDQVDLVLIHWPSQHLAVADTIRPLNDVKRRGLTRHIGVSNFTLPLLAEAWAATSEPLVTNQCEYHPYLNQDRVLAACRAKGMSFTAYAPLGRKRVFDEPAIAAAAARHGKTQAQIVLRWEIQQPGVLAIPKSASPDRMRENLSVFDFSLSEAEMAAISAISRRHHQRICDFSSRPSGTTDPRRGRQLTSCRRFRSFPRRYCRQRRCRHRCRNRPPDPGRCRPSPRRRRRPN